eukprot:SAG22_NODE_914_length_6519_cov_1.701713_8_plen_261_part_00
MLEINSAARKAVSSRYHILVVDDDDFNVQVIRDMVESVGWTCEIAENGSQALDLIAQRDHQTGGLNSSSTAGQEPPPTSGVGAEFSCVVSDCIMPVLDGWQLTRKIRQLQPAAGGTGAQGGMRRRRLPVIGLTGSVSEEDLNRCQEVGMDHVLTKPVKMADLVQTVQAVVWRNCSAEEERKRELLTRILLVDDDEFNLSIVQDMLEGAGWQCQTARTGIEALELLRIAHPRVDLVRAMHTHAHTCTHTHTHTCPEQPSRP